MTATPTTEEIADRLSAVRAKRGYLLPHHGLMAITAPKLLDAYDAIYTAMALDDRILSRHDREFVWLGVLISTDEANATHHIAKFLAAGGTNEEVDVVMDITALALGFVSYRFVATCWTSHLPGIAPHVTYLRGLKKLAGDVPMRLVHMTAAAVHTCRAAWDALAVQIEAAYADAVPEADLAEALSLAMFPGSVPHFVEAARVWLELVEAGRVPASPAFRAWAGLAGQGGWDEATKKA